MKIDAVIDVVCPWCYVGKRQLDLALSARPSLKADVWWRPYQLGPDTPKEGIDRKSYYAKKFPDQARLAQMREHLSDLGKSLGITFDFESECLIANTLDAHRLIRWARADGVQDAVVTDLMQRYFEDSAFLGAHELLVDVAAKAGMDAKVVADLLNTERDNDLVQSEIAQARKLGVQGVPVFIIDGKAAISGAQGVDAITDMIDKLKE
ncbi:DsbA family oxidoreductase [Kordiimonas pumila]|uniref:DsbA family oxidoreductase n=1 Tax=Kordiimonas pumila TaxID=2161677 RepID=A0ABV7D2W8_9PROT|nr:DsbA family oxidoreductase [Kordiimonas pumila]